MSLQLQSTGNTVLKTSEGSLELSQTGLSKFNIVPGKIIIGNNYIFCDTYTFRKNKPIPVLACWVKGNGTVTVDLASKTFTKGTLSGDCKFTDYATSLAKVLNLSNVTATHTWSCCKSSTTDSTIISDEQTKCLNGTNFDKAKYSLAKQAPVSVAVNSAIGSIAATPIGVALTNKTKYTITQSSTTSNVYYTISVSLTWVN